jgi:two-component system, OmpR family, alkaline phosphatase synthesis response regulator PhoP
MSHRILVCDDEPHITRAVGMKLTKAGFVVETVSDGEAAWAAILREPPALLVTDFQMPRLDGVSLCRRLREQEATRDLPIIILTANSFELDGENLRETLNLRRIMVKPFSPRELLQTVQDAVGLAEVAQ